MDKSLTTELTSNDESYIRAVIDEYFAAMRKLREQMTRDGEEIQRLRAETRVIIERMDKGRLNVEAILRPGSAGIFSD